MLLVLSSVKYHMFRAIKEPRISSSATLDFTQTRKMGVREIKGLVPGNNPGNKSEG